MKRQTNSHSISNSLGREFHHRLREVACIVGFALASYLLLSLVTYHSTDPGWSHTGSVKAVTNAGGRAGAWFADAFLHLFGYVAYLLPVGVAFAGWQLYRPKTEEKIDYFIWLTKLAGFLLMLLAADGLIQLHALQQMMTAGFKSGGIIGYLIAASLVKVFNHLGTSILLICVFLSGITLSSGLSWFVLLEMLGRFSTKNMYAISQKIKLQFQMRIARFKAWRESKQKTTFSSEPAAEFIPPQISIRRQQRSIPMKKPADPISAAPVINEPLPEIAPPRFLKKTQPAAN